MRRNVRWGGAGAAGVRYGAGVDDDDDLLDHPLIADLKSLRRAAFAWDPRRLHDVDPSGYLRPFLAVVSSDETGAPITGAALSSVHKLISLDALGFAAAGAVSAMGEVVDAVTTCRFEVTDPASEEAVLARVLQVLHACLRSPAAATLSNRHVCAAVTTCFRIVQQAGNKGELLQRISRQTMQEVIRSVFARLPELPSMINHQVDSPDQEHNSIGKELENGNGDYVCLDISGQEVGKGSETIHAKIMMEPFGIPCIVEILQFLCSLLSLVEDINMRQKMNPIDFDEDVPLFALGVIGSAIELGASSICRHPKLLAFVQDELFYSLMRVGQSMSPLILSMVCTIVLNLFHHLRDRLKLQLEAFFSSVILRVAQSRYVANYQLKEVAMEALVDFCRREEFMAEMYANMDCDIMCSNVFEDLINLLSKSTFPVNSRLSSLHVLAMDGLVASVKALADRADKMVPNFDRTVMDISEYSPFWLLTCENISDPEYWVRFVQRQKQVKKSLVSGVEYFNKDDKNVLEYLQSVYLLPENLDPASVALFLRYTSGLDKNVVGDFLGSHNEFSIMVLYEFARTFDFRGLSLDTSLRLFLETFRLPGESQKIHRVLEAFAERYYEQSPQIFVNKDAVLVLSYSIILLNTDQHNVKVKKKMTEDDFIRNNRRINGGNDLPREFLSELYHNICRNEIRTHPEQGAGYPEMTFSRWVDLIERSKKTSPYILCNSCPFLDYDMFSIMAGPTVAAVSVVFDYIEPEDVLQSCVDGFLAVAKLAARNNLDAVLNDLVVSLCKFTTLLNTTPTDDPVTAYADAVRARMATETVFTIATTYGDHIRSGWGSMINCILRLRVLDLLPARLTTDAAEDSESSASVFGKLAVSSPSAPLATPKRSFGFMGIGQLLYLGGEEPRSQPTEQQLAARQKAVHTINRCQIPSIFSESKFLQADSLLHLVKALIEAAGSLQKISGSPDDENSAIFCLDLLIAVTLNNRDRISLLWQSVYEHIANIVQATTMPCNLVDKAVFGLLHICQRLLPYKENLADDLLRSLQLILKLDARVADAYCENITKEVVRLVKANATHIKSQAGWRTITSLLSITARHPDAYDAGYEGMLFIMSEGVLLSPANFVLSIETARQFAESRLGPMERSIQALDLMVQSVNRLVFWTREAKGVEGEAERILEGITEMWLWLLLGLSKMCTDQREEVRNHALLSLQKCVGVDGINVSVPAWSRCFDTVFKLLDKLLEISQNYSPKDYRNMEGSLLHGAELLCKVFLQSLKDISEVGSFNKLWLEVLVQMEKYIKARVKGRRTDKLQEGMLEFLKNMLLAMKASGILSRRKANIQDGLWQQTWSQVSKLAPKLQSEVFPEHEEVEQEASGNNGGAASFIPAEAAGNSAEQ